MAHVIASENHEHISGWNRNSSSIEFVCGENKRDEEVFNSTSIAGVSKSNYRTVSFKNCRFHEMVNNFFETFENLQTFNISGVELETLEIKAFNGAKNLTKLLASNNRLTEIPSHLFIYALQIKFVDFSNNSIKSVNRETFKDVAQLKSLNLSSNRIIELEANWLDLTSLLTLDLSHNNLTDLSSHTFDDLINLKHLNLSYNPIGNLEIGTFAYLTQLEILSMKCTNISSIQLGTFSHQQKLISLDLSRNQMKHMDFSLFMPIMSDLQSLDLSKNQLTELKSFRNEIVPQLKFLDIKNNRFNCSYLQQFMAAAKWDTLRLPVDARSTNIDQENIRGINCDKTKSAPWNGHNSNGIASLSPDRSNNDFTIIEISLITLCVCVIIVILLIVFLGRHRLFSCAYRQEKFDQQQSTTTLANQSVNFKSEQRLYHTID